METKTIPDPILNDLLYTLLYNASYADKRKLPKKYLDATMTERKAKAFIESSTDEDKKVILSTLGMRFFWCFVKEDFDKKGLLDLLENFNKDKKASALSDILDKGLFVTSDKEFVKLLSFVSRAVHHNSYYINMEYKRQGFHLQRWKKRMFLERDTAVRNAEENAINLSKNYLKSFCVGNSFKVKNGLSQWQINILLYMYAHQNISFAPESIVDYFENEGYVKRATSSAAIKHLHKEGFIEADKFDDGKKYTITTRGISVVVEFFKTIFE